MPFSIPASRPEEGVIAGVCAGIAQALAVDATLVRLVFAILALAGGAGILLYLALWAYSRYDGAWWAAVPAIAAGSALLHALGLSTRSVIGIALVAAGLAVAWRGGARTVRSGVPISYVGIAITAAGAVVLLQGGSPDATLLAPGAIAGALLLITGPWVWRLVLERDAERAAHARSEERADMAARVHDSVLQTLALIQRQADDPRRVAAIARRQERELRGWLYGDRPLGDDEASLLASLSAAAADVEELHGVRIELASSGDCAVDERTRALVLAAREAMTNAAKFAGVEEIDVYVEADDDAVSVFVRDRGAGFDRAAVPGDRRGIAESIEGRLERAGGSATIATAPGAGTEVELRLPRSEP
jgi:signal transduction histidine kinase